MLAAPSRDDNLPLSAIEAQSCGTPVVGFNVGGIPDIVDHNSSGFIADAGDFHNLAEGPVRAIEDSLGRDSWSLRAPEHAVKTWSPKSVASRYLRVYERNYSG